MSTVSTDPPSSDPLIWIAAAALAVMLHLVAFAQGLSAFQDAVNAAPAARQIETRIIATSLTVAGEAAPVIAEPDPIVPERITPETPASATAETVEPVSSAPASPSVERLSSVERDAAPLAAQDILSQTAPTTTAEPEAVAAVENTAPVAPSSPQALPLQSLEDTESAAPVATPGITAPEPTRLAQVPQTAAPPETESISPATPDRERIAEVITPVEEQPTEPINAAPAETQASPEPERLSDVTAPSETAPTATVGPETLALLDTEPESVSPVVPPTDGEETPGIASPNVPVQTAEEAQATYTDVLDVLRAYPVVDCFAALPSLSESNEFHLETFARSTDDLDQFRAALETETQTLPGTVMKPISAAQCDALPFITKSPQYPEFQLYFDLANRDIPSGSQLEGQIGNLTGGFMSLLLIDDDGIVQDLTSFLRFRPGVAEFSIPMTLQGSPVETRQLLMALSTTTRLQTLSGLSGQPADDVFSQLALEIALQGGGEDIALVAFSVR